MRELGPAGPQHQDRRADKDMRGDSFQMRLEDVDSYLAELSPRCAAKTVKCYRYALQLFYDELPAGKWIGKSTLVEWADRAAGSYTQRYVDYVCGICNRWLRYMGHGNYQRPSRGVRPSEPRAKLTREEYLLLLDTAKRLGQERTYLLAKVFAATGISLSELSALTVETVKAGKLDTTDGTVVIPAGLREELGAYAERQGIDAGPVFLARDGQPLSATRVSIILHGLGEAAGLGEGKSRSTSFRELYLAAKEKAEEMVAATVEQAMDRQAGREPEQLKAYMEA